MRAFPERIGHIRAFGPSGKWGILYVMDNVKVYVSHRNRLEHYYRKLSAWGISQHTLDCLEAERCSVVALRVAGEGDIMANVADFHEHGVNVSYASYEPQCMLAQQHWVRIRQLQVP